MRAIVRRSRALPLGDIPAGGTLAILTGSLVCLAVLALAAGGSARATLQRLEAEPRRLTVALPTVSPGQDGSTLARIAEELRRMPGVLAVREVPAAELRALLPAGMLDPRAVSLPRLIEMDFASDVAPEPDELAGRLSSIAPGVTVATPAAQPSSRAADARRVLHLGWLGAGLSLAALVVGVAMVARWALLAQAEGVRLLRGLGANDAHVSRQFEEHAARAALAGAAVGFLAALAVLALIAAGGLFWPAWGPIGLRLAPADWLSLAAVPVAGGLLAGWVAKLTVRIGLRHLR